MVALTSMSVQVAGAQPIETRTAFSSSVVGLNIQPSGYAGYSTPFVNSRLTAVSNTDEPGTTRFAYNGTHCGCTVRWRNVDTGASGSWTMSAVPSGLQPVAETGFGRIEATAKIDGNFSVTVVTGRGSWVVA